MNPWIAYPAWQNFSSLFREAITSDAATTGMEKSHHLTAALYFGIAALEAFLNDKMRGHMGAKSDQEIIDVLRKGQIGSKLTKWPKELLTKPLNLGDGVLDQILFFNDIRSHLTHPKSHGQDIYEKLEAIDPISVTESIAEYIVRFHEAEGTTAPYWIFGWNYLNPRPNSCDIFLINDQQFFISLQALGFRVTPNHWEIEEWRRKYLGTFQGYVTMSQALDALNRCERKWAPFPFRPTLCRRWWTAEHQATCGHVTDAAIDIARKHAI